MGWFNGNPATLWEHPPVAAALRHVEFMGGTQAVLDKARASFAEKDFRWVAQVVNYVIFADPDNAEAKALQADTFEQLGFGAENGTWRNFYLTGAYELRHGSVGTPTVAASEDISRALNVEQIFDAIALMIDGPRAWDAVVTIDWRISGSDTAHRTELKNGLLVHFDIVDAGLAAPDATLSLAPNALHTLLLGGGDLKALVDDGAIAVEGDFAALSELTEYLDHPDPDFAIVTP